MEIIILYEKPRLSKQNHWRGAGSVMSTVIYQLTTHGRHYCELAWTREAGLTMPKPKLVELGGQSRPSVIIRLSGLGFRSDFPVYHSHFEGWITSATTLRSGHRLASVSDTRA